MGSSPISSSRQSYNMNLNRYMAFVIQLLRLISRQFNITVLTYCVDCIVPYILLAVDWLQRSIVNPHWRIRWAFRSRANEF
jgi:hypothetical protein